MTCTGGVKPLRSKLTFGLLDVPQSTGPFFQPVEGTCKRLVDPHVVPRTKFDSSRHATAQRRLIQRSRRMQTVFDRSHRDTNHPAPGAGAPGRPARCQRTHRRPWHIAQTTGHLCRIEQIELRQRNHPIHRRVAPPGHDHRPHFSGTDCPRRPSTGLDVGARPVRLHRGHLRLGAHARDHAPLGF